jgi:hypothetical protein
METALVNTAWFRPVRLIQGWTRIADRTAARP